MVTKEDRDRAHRLGVLAARTGRRGCPYRANGDAGDRILTGIYVRAYIAGGGDSRARAAGRRGGPAAPAAGGTFGHLGMPV